MGDHTGAPRRRAWGMILAAVVALAALSGCAAAPGMSDTSVASAASSRHYHSPRYGLAIAYPQGVPAARRFEADYFLGTRWNPDAAAAVPGDALLALTLPGSNTITRGVMRIGASRAPRALAACSGPSSGPAGAPAEPRRVLIDGVAFTRVDTGDAAMNHHLQRHSYRAVTAGRCIAIDLIVTGVNPSVYASPPARPFDRETAFARLEALLSRLRLE
ncbi:hypothetical protein SAOR_09475 [Salinisphaera orenii MK-B5]|uniref:Uncharacterized protein n=1 Tax=Salinisphaera orenii MK-B5 TaxID=856730 RepID=A0A423PNA1_9GAMM|nr:hypothetical protein [Salinisphaera orenii]ROO27059.1 hypothetical protein SAOR_09475 [Salinisphaera orenii MK-B5]